jgi:hypothetical protein
MLWVTDSRPHSWAVTDGSTSYRDFLEWRRQAHTFEDLAIFYKRGWSVVTLTGEEPEKVQGAFVSANLFTLMGVHRSWVTSLAMRICSTANAWSF